MRGLISFVVVSVMVIVQLTIVDRIAFPGGAGPNLVLLAVAALALAGGPLTGVLIGFWGGLALDVAPPGSHFVGQDALVFCLIGYACGLLADDSSGDAAGAGAYGAIRDRGDGGRRGLRRGPGGPARRHAQRPPRHLAGDQKRTPGRRGLRRAAVPVRTLCCRGGAAPGGLARRGTAGGWSASQARTPVPGANQGAIRQLAGGNALRLRLSDRDKGPSDGSLRDGRGPAWDGAEDL